jgi:protein-L-isoaspartate(D-aspartate) O-methyltransferase
MTERIMTEMNFETARHNMIEQQIRPWNVIDQVSLDVMEMIPRENFVADVYRNVAFSDVELPIGFGQHMLAPKIEAKLLQAVQIKKSDQVLEIGTGSGYLTALLATLAKQVYSIELHEELSKQAQQRLAAEDINNVTYVVADAANGYCQNGPYDVIVLTGSVPAIADEFKNCLAAGGRLFAVVGTGKVMEATLITRAPDNTFSEEALFETVLQPLENIQQADSFTF